MNIWIVILIILLLFGGGAIAPGFGYWGAHQYGWGPSGGIGLVLLIVLILALMGRL
jgi:hypothetical protein